MAPAARGRRGRQGVGRANGADDRLPVPPVDCDSDSMDDDGGNMTATMEDGDAWDS